MARTPKQNRLFLCHTAKKQVLLKIQNEWNTPICVGGTVYDFTHLNKTTFRVLKNAVPGKYAPLDFELTVIFDCHVVTEQSANQSATELPDASHFWLDKGGWLREFCSVRYSKSANLANLVAEAAQGKRHVYKTNGTNALIIQIDKTVQNGNYVIYFDLSLLERGEGGNPHRFLMYVQSAYPKQYKPRRGDQVYITTMCTELLN